MTKTRKLSWFHLCVWLLVMGGGLSSPHDLQAKPPKNPNCKEKISRLGIPHKTEAIARFNAQKAWLRAAEELGPEFAMWHHAQKRGVSCEKLNRSEYYRCSATAVPCRPSAAADKP